MKATIKLTVAVLLLGLVWISPLAAQSDENEGIARVAMITPKDGHAETLVKAITDYHHWVANFEGHHEYQWYSIQTGPNTGKFVARTAGHNWADFDQKYDWEKEAGEVFQRNVMPHIESIEFHFTQEMKEFSNWPENFEGYTHYTVQDWFVHNGQYAAWRKGLKTIVDALKAGGFSNHWGIFSVESGGYGGQIRIVGANKGFTDFSDPDPSFGAIMTEALGGEEQFTQFMAEWGKTFKSGRNWLVTYMPEASDYGK